MSETPPPQPQKYKFDTEFFELVAEGGRAAPQRPLEGSRRDKVYDEGFAEGLKEGRNQAQADLAQLQQHLQNTLIALQKSMEEREKQLGTQHLSLMRVSLHRLVGETLARHADSLLEQHLKDILPLIKADETLTLRIHPGARGYHEKLQLPHAAIMGLPMHIVPDASLGPTDAVVEWRNGGVESKLAQHLKALDALLASTGLAMLPVPPLPAAGASALPAQAETAAPSGATPAAVAAATTLDEAARAAQSRAAELLGDDELVDALKPG